MAMGEAIWTMEVFIHPYRQWLKFKFPQVLSIGTFLSDTSTAKLLSFPELEKSKWPCSSHHQSSSLGNGVFE